MQCVFPAGFCFSFFPSSKTAACSSFSSLLCFCFPFKFEDFFSPFSAAPLLLSLLFHRLRRCPASVLAGGGFLVVVVGVHQLGQNLAGMTGGIEVVGVLIGLPLVALLAAVSREDVLVMVEVVVLVLIEVGLGHNGDLRLQN